VQVAGRVIIDTYAYYSSNNIVKPKLGSLTAPEKREADGSSDKDDKSNKRRKRSNSNDSSSSDSSKSDGGFGMVFYDTVDSGFGNVAADDSDSDSECDTPETNGDNDEDQVKDGATEMTAVSPNRSLTRVEVLDVLTDEQCLLATPWVRGLDLKTKEWGE